MKKKLFNSLKAMGAKKNFRTVKFGTVNLRFKNEKGESGEPDEDDGDGPVDVLLYDDIGKSPWSDRGISAQDFANALKAIPNTSKLNLRINSRGGDVHDGMVMHNLINEWPNHTKATIDGVAASTASWIPMACDEIEMPETAQMFIHDAMCMTFGNAEQLRKDAEDLDTTSDQIAGMYANKSGGKVENWRDKMQSETLMTGKDAKRLGLVDTLTTKKAMHNFSSQEIDSMKEKLALVKNSAPKPGAGQQNKQKDETIMNRKQMIALLNKLGIKFKDDATDDQLVELVNKIEAPPAPKEPVNEADKKLISIEAELARLKEADNAARTLRITNEVQKLVDDDRIPANQREEVLKNCLVDREGVLLKTLNNLPANRPGAEPLKPYKELQNGENPDFMDLQKHLIELGPGFMGNFLGKRTDKRVGEQAINQVRDNSIRTTNLYRKHRNMLQSMYNANTISADLQRIVLLQEALEEFVIQILPLTAFSVVFNNIPLEGTDKVGVPFYPLQTEASTSWVAATGYTFNDSVTNIREVLVGGAGVANYGNTAAANTASDRKFQGLQFDSYTLRRQPFFNALKLVTQNTNKLAVDVFYDIITRLITVGNYGNAVDVTPASAFSSSDIATLYSAATAAQWPGKDRTLVLDHNYNASLIQDPAYKYALNYGATDPIRKAKIEEAYGFENIFIVPNLAANFPGTAAAAGNVTGWINWMGAMLVATSPIMPAPGVRNLLTRYDVVTDPKTGISFEYREMANAQLDQDQYVVECSYGAGLGVASALKRITSAGN